MTTVKRIHVVFQRSDAVALAGASTEGDVLLGDVNVDDLPLRHVAPHLDHAEMVELARRTRELFDGLAARFGDTIRGFVNQFFEASVLPLASYAGSLERLVRAARADGADCRVTFPTRIEPRRFGSTFFLAEHETQGRMLYRRNQVFQPYLEELCVRLNAPVSFRGPSERSSVSTKAPVRRGFTWALRSGFAAAKKARSLTERWPALPTSFDVIAISRLPTKSEYVAPLLTQPELHGHLIVAENFLNFGRNAAFTTLLREGTSLTASPLPQAGVAEMVAAYTAGLARSVPGPVTFEAGAVTIDVTDAVAEMLVNYPDLLLYRSALDRALSELPRPRHNLLLSMEQKSPHAYVDAAAARARGYRCFHLMEADQSDIPIPVPVFGDMFVVESRGALEAFQASWPEYQDKLGFFGSVRGATAAMEAGKRKPEANGRWCFFTGADARKDIPVLQQLIAAPRSAAKDFVVKLHPRDAAVKYARFKGFELVPDGSVPKRDLYSTFEFAVTFNSAVIADLFWYDKPFVLVDIEDEAYFNAKVHQEYGDLLVRRAEDLPAAMREIGLKRAAFDRYRDRFRRRSGESTIGDIVRGLVAAAGSLEGRR